MVLGRPLSWIGTLVSLVIFGSTFLRHWGLKTLGTKLTMIITYHPQMDGQIEQLNHCMEAYLHAMVFGYPKSWVKWLHLAELRYNTNYHTSLKTTHFQALYDYPLPPSSPHSITRRVFAPL